MQHYALPLDGDFAAAELHFLASGQRDSARSLAEMFLQWSGGERAGIFALRGTFPYVAPRAHYYLRLNGSQVLAQWQYPRGPHIHQTLPLWTS
jgi:hypothetical protein